MSGGLRPGDRVLVRAAYRGFDLDGDPHGRTLLSPPRPGTFRLTNVNGGGMWVELDERTEHDELHPGLNRFGSHLPTREVLAFPEDCDRMVMQPMEQLGAFIAALEKVRPPQDPDEHECWRCGSEYVLEDGAEDLTGHCDDCAQELLAELATIRDAQGKGGAR